MTSVLSDYGWFLRAAMRNRVRQFRARIKSPRYAIVVFVGGGYFFLVFILPMLMRSGGPASGPSNANGIMALSRGAGALGLALLAASWWLWRTDREGISLTPAEANLLVPAPLTRRQLIQFKLLGSQPRLMVSALFITFFTHGSTLPVGLRFLSAWVLFATLQMHRYGASLVHTSLAEHGGSGWRRVWPAALIFAAMLVSVLWSFAAAYNATHFVGFTPKIFFAILASPPASIALAPFHAVLAAINATGVDGWARAFVIATAIAALHYVWVVRMDAAFEEGAATAGVKLAARVEAARAGRGARFTARPKAGAAVRKSWFPLAAKGDPAIAVLWKNVLAVTRGLSARMLSSVVMIIVLLLIFSNMPRAHAKHSGLMVAGTLALGYGAMVSLMGPLRIRHDFRNDLQKIELLRTLPVGGSHLAGAEIATSAVVVSLLQLALVLAGIGAISMSGMLPHRIWFLYGAVPAVLALFALNATIVTMHNLAAILFPAWSAKPGGIEMFGTAIVVMLAAAIMIVLSLVGPTLVGLVAYAGMGMQWGSRAYIPAITGFLAGMYVQLLLLVIWVGHAYDRMDPIDHSQMS